MRKFALLSLITMLPIPGDSTQGPNLMPVPASLKPGQGKLKIDETFRAALSGFREPRLEDAVARLVRRLAKQTGIPIPLESAPDPAAATLVVYCDRGGERVQTWRADESYQLMVTPQQARLRAATPLGVLRGIETFLQLVELDRDGFAAPAVEIADAPRFPWRGLLLDVCRHWMPLGVVKRTLDGMAAVKLNVFHWHLADDQGFRIESKRFPKLQELGSDGRYFTQEEAREVLAYARARGIRVVPEFDLPGHTTSWFVGYPELASAPGPYAVERSWGIFDPAMDPTREEVYTFLDGFIGEMAALFPDEYFHIGGDEVNGKQWNASPRIQEFMRAHRMQNHQDLQAYFTRRVQALVEKHGKKTIGWDEILHPDLPRDLVVQSWRGQKSLAQAARRGFMGILSFGYYLDHMRPAAYHYRVDPLAGEAANLTDEEKKRILGGEACMWAEYVTPENVDQRIWPRAAAIAERLWSPQSTRDADSMYRRLEIVSRHLEWLGLTHGSGYIRMLERLAGSNAFGPVKVLADVVEPIKEYSRGSARKYTSRTPLNRLVDAARPESDTAREFGKLVDQTLATHTGHQVLLQQLALWRDNETRLAPILEDSALLSEAAPLSNDLSALAAMGLQALEYLESKRRPSRSWVQNQLAFLDRAQQPRAELLLSVVPPMRKLVEAVK